MSTKKDKLLQILETLLEKNSKIFVYLRTKERVFNRTIKIRN